MNPWLRYPILVLTAPIWLVVAAFLAVVIGFITLLQLSLGALLNEMPTNLIAADFWNDVIRDR